MKFKDFVNWCNQRAQDGQWDMTTALVCIRIMSDVRTVPFWKTRKSMESTI